MLGARGAAPPATGDGGGGTSGEGKPKSKAKAAAKPKASAPSIKKKPAAPAKKKPAAAATKASKAPVSLKQLCQEYKSAGKTRGAFTTKAYYDACNASIRRGGSAVTAKMHAKAAHGRAAALWDSCK